MAHGFTGGALDRADAVRGDPDKVAALARSPDAALLVLNGFDPVTGPGGVTLDWRPMPDHYDPQSLILLGLDRGMPCFVALHRATDGGVPDGDPRALWGVLSQLRPADAALYGLARTLLHWHSISRFCGRCGAATLLVRAGWGRRCSACAAESFPRVDPVVIMLAEHRGADGGARVLVGRQPRFPPGRYSALAGFVEPGESIEEAVVRELHEEAGIIATGVTYVCSQPWPFPGSLMIACLARTDDDRLMIDRNELDDARWVTGEEVVAALAGDGDAVFIAPPPLAVARSLLEHWVTVSRA